MKLLINTATTFQGGAIQVAKSFIEECIIFSEHEYHVVLSPKMQLAIDKDQFPPNFSFYSIDYRPATRLFKLQRTDSFFKKLESKIKPDCVFTTSGPAYWRPKAPHVMGFNLPHYLYPDSPYFRTISFKKRLFWKLKGLLIKYFTLRDADTYVVQTDDVNNRLKSWLQTDKPVITVSNTTNKYFDEPTTTTSLKLPFNTDSEFRLLFLGGFHAHKNYDILNHIVPLLPVNSKIRFVLTLPDEAINQFFIKETLKYCVNIGPVKPEECPALYTECDAVFLPTLLECFSATYVEAMKMKKPIITSDLGFAHTVCGDAALYFNPVKPSEAIEALFNLMNDEVLYRKLVDNGETRRQLFNSASMRAKKYLTLCEEMVEYQD